jgi:hypothetical protein
VKNIKAIFELMPKKHSKESRFFLDDTFYALHYGSRMTFGSSSCRVTGVFPELGPPPHGQAGFFLLV